jgi:hypothetical protein
MPRYSQPPRFRQITLPIHDVSIGLFEINLIPKAWQKRG